MSGPVSVSVFFLGAEKSDWTRLSSTTAILSSLPTMKIHDVWKVWNSASDEFLILLLQKLDCMRRLVSLLELAVREGFLRNARNTRSLVVGIDARWDGVFTHLAHGTDKQDSVWIVECQATFYVQGLHTQAGENPELCTLFFHLAHLLRYPITAIFVFDGPERPDYKHSMVVKKKAHWAVKHFSEIIQLFSLSISYNTDFSSSGPR